MSIRRHWPLWLAVVPLGAWALVRSFGLEDAGALTPLLAFTPYATIALLLVAGVCVALRNWPAALVATIAFLALAAAVLPRAFGSGEEAPPGATRLTVLSTNIYHGKADPEALLALIDRVEPDLVSIQELNHDSRAELSRLGIDRRFPESRVFLHPGMTGAALYSKYPLRPLSPPGLSPRMLSAEIAVAPGTDVRVVDVHPFTPSGNHVEEWADELGALPRTGAGAPWLLVGDFNATLDHAELREVLSRGYRDAAETTGSGLIPTWPNGRAYPPLIAIDHVLADRRLGISTYGVEDLPGTDHRAIHAELFLR